jgi:Cytochrome oxidase complex assembly protein 1
MIYRVIAILSPLITGAAFLFLGRWMYRNPTKLQANWLYANPQHPFLIGFRRVLATIFIFAGSFFIVVAVVSQRMEGSSAFFVSLAGGAAGALFLRPRVEKPAAASRGDMSSAGTPVKRSFLSNKGKWAVGISVGVAFLLCIGIIGLIGSSEVCRLGVQQAQSNSAVAARLGEPIKQGFVVGGSIKMSGSSGSANLEIPLSGPRASGTLYAVAERRVGTWKFETLQLAVRGDPNRVDLLSVPAASR